MASKTRVCIKNLPPTANEQDVKEFLTETSKQRIEITDCKVLKNAKGKSRKVAFVGFRHESQAKYIVDNCHRVFMGMTRLSVEPALAKKDEEDTESKAPKSTGKAETKSKSETDAANKSKHKEDILKLAGGSVKSKFWANDEVAPPLSSEEPHKQEKIDQGTEKDDNDSESDSSTSDESESEEENEEEDSPAVVDDKPKPSSGALSDLDFLRSKQQATEDLGEADGDDLPTASNNGKPEKPREEEMQTDSEVEDEDVDDTSESSSSDEENPEDNAALKKNLMKTGSQEMKDAEEEEDDEDVKKEEMSKSRLFVRNLPFETTEEELEEYFSAIGTLVECHIPVDDQKRNKGFAFVQYSSAVDALEARKQLDKIDFQGRLLHILPAKPAPNANQSGGDGNSTWKQSREQARKEQDTKNGGDGAKGWSASFVRGDAVVDNLADRLGLRKADFLGVKDKLSSGDAAVRLALGETQIIEENREYFRQNGVDMEALVSAGNEKTIKRSKTSILVKNLPYDTRIEELNKLFQMGDESVKILLPPSRTIALVEYGHHSDAKRAFRKLAYRRFKHVPIYLEWAPLAAKTEAQLTETDATTNTQTIREPDEVEVETDGTVSTIYVKNLNFATTEETLRQVFEKNVGVVRSVRIPQKVAPAKSGEEPQLMSMGYGFVELESESSVKKAIQVLQGKLVEGHAWEITISNKKGSSGPKSKTEPSGKNPTKLIARNVPFQATRKELLKLFGTFGQLRKVRLPKKFDGSHRGFAFVEFLTSKEAVAAMNALSRTHLYGRHLVLEWATDDDQDIDRLREKAKRDTEAATLPKNKKIRFT